MDAVTPDAVLERLADFFERHRPQLEEILGSACQLYRIDPDNLGGSEALMARGVYCYLAYRWAAKSLSDIGRPLGSKMLDVWRLAKSIDCRSSYDDVLRDDLDLLAVMVAERVMLRGRCSRGETDA
jgi:hypothetical protein